MTHDREHHDQPMFDRQQILEDIFRRALELPAKERAAFITDQAQADDALRDELLSLLASHEEADEFLESQARIDGPILLSDASLAEMANPLASTPIEAGIGHYKIVEIIGEGGMGIVYRAEQKNPARTVALKVIRPGMLSDSILARFAYETEALGRLQHPGIAQIFEANTAHTTLGEQPYFAMEFVKGEDFATYTSTRSMTLQEKALLLAQICDAVHHAHQRGIIHRDIKPGNILVTEKGMPKILDFGVARATNRDLQAATLRTDIGQLIGTLAYMSPEQTSGDSRNIDTRTDIYSLGVLGYETFCGKRPHDIKDQTIHEAIATIRSKDPLPLGVRDRTLRGDLETIFRKALEKEKERRYSSAEEFSSDLRRYCAHEPIEARPPSTIYQLRKFTQRHRALVVGSVSCVLLLILGIIGTAMGWSDAVDARNVAKSESTRREKAETLALEEMHRTHKINEFLQDMLYASNYGVDPRGEMTLREFLENAAANLEREVKDPIIRSSLQSTIGNTYRSLGNYEKAEKYLRQSLALREGMRPRKPLAIAESLSYLAALEMKTDLDAAEQHCEEALSMYRQFAKADRLEYAECASNRALIHLYRNQTEEAVIGLETSLKQLRAIRGDDHPQIVSALLNLGAAYEAAGRIEHAAARFQEATTLCRIVKQDGHPLAGYCDFKLGSVLLKLRQNEGARKALRSSCKMLRQVYGDEDSNSLKSMFNYAVAIHRLSGDKSRAIQLLERVVEVRSDDSRHPDKNLLEALDLLGLLYFSDTSPRFDKASDCYSRCLKLATSILEPDAPMISKSHNNLAEIFRRQGKPREAARHYEEAIASRKNHYGAAHSLTIKSIQGLGNLYYKGRAYEPALKLFQQAARAESTNRDDSLSLATSYHMISTIQIRLKDFQAAEVAAREAMRLRRSIIPPDDPRLCELADSILNLAASLEFQNRPADAEPEHQECYRIYRDSLGPQHKKTLRPLKRLVIIYKASGETEKAAQYEALMASP